MLVALKLQNCIHNMFQDFRTRDIAILSDMSDQKGRNSGGFTVMLKLSRTLLDLRYGTGSRVNESALHRLDGVDNHQLWIDRFEMFEDLPGVGFC